MADTQVANFTDLLYEMRGPMQEAYPKGHPATAELTRDTSRENFSGNQVRVPIFASNLQGVQAFAEGATITTPQVDDTLQAHVKMGHIGIPVSFSIELMKQTLDNAAVQVAASKVKRARESLARGYNEQLNGDGTALLAAVTDAATSLTVTLAAGAPKRQFYKGRIVDVRTRSNGADPGQGLKRKIVSTTLNANGTVNTVTFDTNAFGGGSGNIVHAATEGVYAVDSYGAAIQGFQQIGAVTGTFEDIDKAANEVWQGTLNTTGGDPLLSVLDSGFLSLGERTDKERVDFILGDPGVNLKIGQLHYAMLKYQAPVGKLETGFEGISYKGVPIIDDFDHQRGALTGVSKEDLQVYGYAQGPDWDEVTGSMYQRFSRVRNVEAWLIDDVQLGAHRCDTMLRWTGLNRAS